MILSSSHSTCLCVCVLSSGLGERDFRVGGERDTLERRKRVIRRKSSESMLVKCVVKTPVFSCERDRTHSSWGERDLVKCVVKTPVFSCERDRTQRVWGERDLVKCVVKTPVFSCERDRTQSSWGERDLVKCVVKTPLFLQVCSKGILWNGGRG
jgi:hypothetical protein